MKKILSIILAIGMFLSCVPGSMMAAKLESGVESQVFGENDFYVKQDQNRVYWGGGFTATEKLDDEDYQLLIGIYDDERLVSVSSMQIDENLDSFIFNEQCTRLSYAPSKLNVKAFAWSNDGFMRPLSEPVEAQKLSDEKYCVKGRIVEFNKSDKTLSFSIEYSENFEGEFIDENNIRLIKAEYSDVSVEDYFGMLMEAEISCDENGVYKIESYKINVQQPKLFALRPYFKLDNAEENISLIGRDGKVYIDGNAKVETQGKGLYSMVLRVKDGDNTVWEENITLTSEINEFNVYKPLDIAYNKYLYLTVDFVYEGQQLTETTEKDITDGCVLVVGRITEFTEANNTAVLVIEEAENFEGEKITGENKKTIEINVEGYDISDALALLADIKLEGDKQGYKLVSCVPYPKNEVITLASDLYVENSFNSGIMEFYRLSNSSRTDEYKLSEDVRVYVNGVLVRTSKQEMYVEEYMEYPNVEVKLVNTPMQGQSEPDEYYDYVMINIHATAVVDEVIADGDEIWVYLADFDLIDTAQILFDADNTSYSIVDTQGNRLEPKDLKENDVLTIYADVYSDNTLEDVENIEIIVSRNIVEGVVTNEDPENNEYKIGDVYYGFAMSGKGYMNVGYTYRIYLDSFGKIAKYEITSTNVNYGIINRVWETSNGEPSVRLVNADGEIVTYEFKNTTDFNDWRAAFDDFRYEDFEANYKKLIVTYKVDNQGKIYNMCDVTTERFNIITAEYSERYKKIGMAKMSDNTAIVEFRKAAPVWSENISGKVYSVPLSYFIDGETYTVIYGGEKFTDGTYPFVVVIKGVADISTASRFAVVKSTGRAVNDADGVEYASAVILEGREEKTLYFEDDTVADEISKGSVLVYHIDYLTGLVNVVEELYNAENSITLEELEAAEYNEDPDKYGSRVALAASGVYSWDDSIGRLERNVNVGFGALIERADSYIVVGKVEDGKSAVYDEIELASDVNVYVYDQGVKYDKLSAGDISSLVATKIATQFIETDGEDVYNWAGAGKNKVNTVFFKTFEDEITDIIIVKPAK